MQSMQVEANIAKLKDHSLEGRGGCLITLASVFNSAISSFYLKHKIIFQLNFRNCSPIYYTGCIQAGASLALGKNLPRKSPGFNHSDIFVTF